MVFKRVAKHLLMTHWQVRRAFPPAALQAIEQAITASEACHQGEIRFVVEGALHFTPLIRDQAPRERAIDVFSALRIWDTEHNNGVLIYLLLADRTVEIVADRGIHARIADGEWRTICRQMEAAFSNNDFAAGAVNGIAGVTHHLRQHFPLLSGHKRRVNELPNQPVLM